MNNNISRNNPPNLSSTLSIAIPTDQKTQATHLRRICESIFVDCLAKIVKFCHSQFYSESKKFPPLPSCALWKPRKLTEEEAFDKMVKNARKAFEEHHLGLKNCYALDENLDQCFQQNFKPTAPLSPLTMISDADSAKGPRDLMEDCHFICDTENGCVAGVFDGHGGPWVAKYASKQFQKRFNKELLKVNHNVFEAFESLTQQINQEINKEELWKFIGTTAVITYIDKSKHLIYTATIGDSEANIYRRKENNKYCSIALSCVRDWSHYKEASRAAIAYNSPRKVRKWTGHTKPKSLRCEGLNLSRALGDLHAQKIKKISLVIPKPKITVSLLQPGKDLVVLACDGLKDYVLEEEIIDILESNANEHQKAASILVKNARSVTRDNLTVVSLLINNS